MMSRSRDLIGIVLLNAGVIGLIVLGQAGLGGWVSVLRIPAGFIYLVFVPGYVLQEALLPRRDHLGSLDRLVISIGLSVAIMPVMGLILDGPLGGIHLLQSVVFLTVFTLTFVLVAAFRRSRLKTEEQQNSMEEAGLGTWWRATGGLSRILFVAMLVILVAGVAVTVLDLTSPKQDQFFTEFYLIGPEGAAIDYPREVAVNQPLTLHAGVTNDEGRSATYAIIAHIGEQVVASTPPFTLNDGQAVQMDLTVVPTRPGDRQRLEILLARENVLPYRTLYLFLDVKPGP